ncbi:MAG: hypothetical protein KIT10_07475 [Flavobacteriales bacterium]|nr:hypothetical protein [Flavobacteriales bacterium]
MSSMDFRRRLLRYLIGVAIGLGLSILFLGDRLGNMAWTPQARIKQRLTATLVRATPQAEEAMRARSITLEEVRASIPESRVHLRATRRTADSIWYTLRAEPDGVPALLVIAGMRDADVDSTATLWSLAGP